MSKEAFIFEVSDSSFEKYVINNSAKVPVFVVFMAAWSEHCALVTETFTALAKEFAEAFIFAKVDIDENEKLKQQFEVTNVPTLKIFVDGEIQLSEEGVISEHEARILLKHYGIVNQVEETRLQARQHHMQGETQQAILLLTQAIQQDASNTNVVMDMVQIFIDIGQSEQATALFNRLPESVRNSETGVSLSGQLWIIDQAAKTAGLTALKETLANDPDNFDARFDRAICELAQHDPQAALEQLFYIQQNNADYKEGAAREMIVSIINTLAANDPELAQQYRSQLAAMLS